MESPTEEAARYYLERRNEYFGDTPAKELLDRLAPLIVPQAGSVLAADVGCCAGEFVEHLARLCPEPDALILGFEPNPLNLPLLRRRSFRRAFEPIACALSDSDGVETLRTIVDSIENRPGYSLASLNGDGHIIAEVPVITFDEVIERLDLSSLPLRAVKIDTEGHDTKVIRGMRQALERIQYLLFESSDCLDDRRGPGEDAPLASITQFLDARGFDTYKVGRRRLLRQNGDRWHECFEHVKFHSNSFAIRKEDPLIYRLIDADGFFL